VRALHTFKCILSREPSSPFYTVPQNGGDDCARIGWVGASAYKLYASPFLKNFVWRGSTCIPDFVQTARLEHSSRLFLIVFEFRPLPFLGILKRKGRPSPLPPIPFLNSPREKNQNGNGAAGAEGDNAEPVEAWAGFSVPKS